MTGILLAKTSKPNELSVDDIPYSSSLLGHSEQCLDVARLFNEYAATSMVQVCGSRSDVHVDWFRKALLLASAIHDIGKSTRAFQSQLRGQAKSSPYFVRHEVVSYWMMTRNFGIEAAIRGYFSSDNMTRLIPLVEAAVLGHHLKFPRRSTKMKSGDKYFQGPLDVLISSFKQSGVAELLGDVLGTTINLTNGDKVMGTEDWLVDEVKRPFKESIRAQNYSEVEQMLGAMLRGALIAVDTLGSLQFRTRAAWLESLAVFRSSWQSRFNLKFEQVVDEHLKDKEHHRGIDRFQGRVATAEENVVIVEAGCGLGKTIAAYKRAAHSRSRGMFVTFPTTSVASQVYEDYALEGGLDSQLLHSRSAVDMELLYSPPSEVDDGDAEESILEIEESLRRLMAPVTFCTVDTVLGILQMRRSSLCLLPAICQSMVVFDEIHSFSPELFKHLLAFVRYFDLHMVMMTATLPPAYRVAMQTALETKSVAWIRGPKDIESVRRYRLRVSSGLAGELLSDEMITRVREAVAAGQKVLIVQNRVEWAKAVFRQLVSEPDLKKVTHLLHSRFKYLDRRKIQQELVQRFRDTSGGSISVTTQICEISFDVSADLLISHVAPFPSMVQRLGRLNRGPNPDSARLGEAIFIPPPGGAPYLKDELATGSEFAAYVEHHSELDMSQLDLRNWLDLTSQPMIHEKRREKFAWFDLDTAMLGDSLREPSHTTDVILRSDFEKSATATDRLKFVLPLPTHAGKSKGIEKWRHYSIVDDADVAYNEQMGGVWRHG